MQQHAIFKKMMRVSTQQGLEFSESPQRLAGHRGSDLQENEAKRRRQCNSCKEPVACDREGLNHKPSRFALPRYGLDCVHAPYISPVLAISSQPILKHGNFSSVDSGLFQEIFDKQMLRSGGCLVLPLRN